MTSVNTERGEILNKACSDYMQFMEMAMDAIVPSETLSDLLGVELSEEEAQNIKVVMSKHFKDRWLKRECPSEMKDGHPVIPKSLYETTIFVRDEMEYNLARMLYQDVAGVPPYPLHKGWKADEEGKPRAFSCNHAGLMLETHNVPGGNEVLSMAELAHRATQARSMRLKHSGVPGWVSKESVRRLVVDMWDFFRIWSKTAVGTDALKITLSHKPTDTVFDVYVDVEDYWRPRFKEGGFTSVAEKVLCVSLRERRENGMTFVDFSQEDMVRLLGDRPMDWETNCWTNSARTVGEYTLTVNRKGED
ncbi:hypothetical protein [Vibrio phage vB_VmeM-Yong XC32]|nr:hypothetical protein [Vibrio phage vB_VmeM-Yong XC31]QAX96597.1 hypothetical protein [Vibrio phage vB_VmeM-Yong XC32]QAX96915.1 hypothetical protein [Vibrio phage vB_VmeM-Yong MS31]QAX97220.1 hypothetical protein [Vibrio phage vB_VmeM-Yong MS32]